MVHPFHSLYTHGFIRTAVCVPFLRVADPIYNAERTLLLAQRADEQQVAVTLFPELGLAAYSSDDLFHQDALLEGVRSAIQTVVDGSLEVGSMLLVGAPLRFEGQLFNCAVVIYRGQILGIVPKSYLPNYREFYEKRQFTAARSAIQREVQLLGQRVPFGNDLIFEAVNVPNFILHTEICEDVWAPLPPSTFASLAGATVLTNLSASNITIGKAEYRHQLCAGQSARCLAAYLYSAAGFGESTTDLAWDGHALIYENGELLAESARFADEEQLIIGDVDLERLAQERSRLTSFNDAIHDYRAEVQALRRVPFEFTIPTGALPLQRHIERFPYVPSDPRVRDERCFEAYNIQVQGLMKRLDATGIKKIVIGVSGGLDSTQALIVAARTMDRLGLPRTNILAYTMPGFATSDRTKSNAWKLMEALGVSAHEIDIRPSAMQMLRDLGHPFAEEEALYDVTFENVQAGERTSHLFRLANYNGALVLGTGDLSELALGWATYGVGDHMSHYNVNVSVPKTLIQYLIRWVISTGQFGDEANIVASGLIYCHSTSAMSMIWQRLRNGSNSFSTASSKSASLNARRSRMGPKWGRVAPFPPVAIGVHRAIHRRRSGWMSCGQMCRRTSLVGGAGTSVPPTKLTHYIGQYGETKSIVVLAWYNGQARPHLKLISDKMAMCGMYCWPIAKVTDGGLSGWLHKYSQIYYWNRRYTHAI